MLSEKKIIDILKKEPKIREYAKFWEEDKICECGHKEKFHHNHKLHAWGAYSICRRCMKCEWAGKGSCYRFEEKRN